MQTIKYICYPNVSRRIVQVELSAGKGEVWEFTKLLQGKKNLKQQNAAIRYFFSYIQLSSVQKEKVPNEGDISIV